MSEQMIVHLNARMTGWRLWDAPRPNGIAMMGTVVRQGGDAGALLFSRQHGYMIGKKGEATPLEDSAVRDALIACYGRMGS